MEMSSGGMISDYYCLIGLNRIQSDVRVSNVSEGLNSEYLTMRRGHVERCDDDYCCCYYYVSLLLMIFGGGDHYDDASHGDYDVNHVCLRMVICHVDYYGDES